MSRTLVISDALYERLERTARQRGLQSIEQLLEEWQHSSDEVSAREATIARIDALRDHLRTKYGEMPDSTTLLREDRAR